MIGDSARSLMLVALMDGRALTATELAEVAGITKQTASSHLARLLDGDLLAVEVQGRHRYYRLATPHVAALLEAMMGFASDKPLRTGPRDPALRKARICYDHLAGEMGVVMFDRMTADGWIATEADRMTVMDKGWTALAGIGIGPDTLPRSNRALCRGCLDWSVRRHHLAGLLGQQILTRFFNLGWAHRLPSSRIVNFSPEGERAFASWLR